MKSIVKNISNSNIHLFVKKNGIESMVEIPVGEHLIVDNYETKTIKIFLRKKLITMIDVPKFVSPGVFTVEPTNSNNVVIDLNVDLLTTIEEEVSQYIEDGYIKGGWSDEEVSYLKKNYPIKGRKFCSTHLNRNETSVQKKVNSLGLKKKTKKK